jgi:Tol biopolymer transport system component
MTPSMRTLLGAAALSTALAAAPALAQHHDLAANAGLQSLTFARHIDTVFSAVTAQTAMTNATTTIQTCDGTPTADQDVACQVTMQVNGGIGTFGATGDGGDVISSNAEMNTLINSGTANVMVVTAIGFCSGPPGAGLTIIGCGNVGAGGIVSVNTLPGGMLGSEITHEFLHNTGHNHRGDAGEAAPVTGAILNPVLNLNSNIINQAECASLHGGAANNGPIVDPPPIITCPATGTAECSSAAGTPKGNPAIAAFLAGASATDGCEPTPTLSNNAPAVFPKGTTTVTFTATGIDFLGTSSTCNADLQVVDTTPPVVTCPSSISVECAQTGGTPAGQPMIAAFLAGASASDSCGATSAPSNNAPAFFALGTTPVTFTSVDSAGVPGHCTANVTIVDTTKPTLPADTTIECTSPLGSTLPFGMPTDTCDGMVAASNDAPPILPFGSTTVTWTATDGSGNTITGTQVVTVDDTTPPTLTVALDPTVLWPPDHTLTAIRATINATDDCDPSPVVRLVSITSSEPDDGTGPRDKPHDIQGAMYLTTDRRFALRAEHAPSGTREYTVTYEAEDAHHNVTSVQVTVRVPKSGATLISRNHLPGNDASRAVAVDAHGGLVAFSSDATNLVTHDTNQTRDVFVRHRAPATTERVSVSSGGVQGNGPSGSPAIDGDGQLVAFSSSATNLVLGDGNHVRDIFVRDRAAGLTERVSIPAGGGEGNGGSSSPSISASGRFVAFQSLADNLTGGDGNGASDIFVRDRVGLTTERLCDAVQGNRFSITPSISADGTVVAFASAATNLVPGDGNRRLDIFVCDRASGTLERVSVDSGGAEANGHSFLPAVSADGRYVAFKSAADNLVPGDDNGFVDVFVRDRVAGTTERISVDRRGHDADDNSFPPSISYDGRFVAFGSYATDLVGRDVNAVSDVFVRDRQKGVTFMVDVNDEGELANRGTLDLAPSITGDGVQVGFVSLATNLAGPDNGVSDVFIVCNPGLPTPP